MTDILNRFKDFIDSIPDEDFIKLVEQSEKCEWIIVLPRLKHKRKEWVRRENDRIISGRLPNRNEQNSR